MENTLLLHILRNPYGWDDNEVRKARLTAADLIEDLERQLEFEKSKKRSRGFVGFGLFNRGELVTCSKHELAISIGSQAIECLPLYVMREGEKIVLLDGVKDPVTGRFVFEPGATVRGTPVEDWGIPGWMVPHLPTLNVWRVDAVSVRPVQPRESTT
jgi:hypothetical protein